MKTLIYEVKEGVARITFNRPDAANALDMQMGLDLMHASIQASEDPAVRVVLITGAGKMFSGGGDLKSFAAQGAALIADGLAGGRHAVLTDVLGIREASGTVLDHLKIITPETALQRLGL